MFSDLVATFVDRGGERFSVAAVLRLSSGIEYRLRIWLSHGIVCGVPNQRTSVQSKTSAISQRSERTQLLVEYLHLGSLPLLSLDGTDPHRMGHLLSY